MPPLPLRERDTMALSVHITVLPLPLMLDAALLKRDYAFMLIEPPRFSRRDGYAEA